MFSEYVELFRSISLGYSFRRNGLSRFDKSFVDLVVALVFLVEIHFSFAKCPID